ncbi:hypothetical protein TCAL_02988 [Tigriopus californicus]|uniref:Serpin domain-containing protein n=1 Tax=Tigriopus californicus TaxID=6832 RepID=A0A553PT52_TIGCA|nr:leukocyte elastase inhibitor-like [Tigriopus californicus]TRY80859.1 hypothetical protein TCAL_02988 [Tigriopus californicus]|eukprot:TCALIF_02988-PA protein Name:"Similar to MM_2675 Uncharacterized serpin-like protein MM_2675 (Methanosarcina mazei (strain ATCC BAA-159 / DSM 3647 / Goe1 / Go1 / JCM 11833 / OCM 88))" AED:0.07 eAED:0.07 QI:133/1/1/1/1/1/4/303/397
MMLLFLIVNFVASACFILVSGQNENFAQETNSKLMTTILNSHPEGNVAFAPFGILVGVASVYEGTAGKTREQLQTGLGFPPNDQVFKAGMQLIRPKNTKYAAYANMITVAKSAKVKSSYGTRIKNVLGSSPFQFELGQKPENARKSINQWVSKNSDGQIKDLMPSGSVTPNTKFVLANVVHYKSEWAKFFDGTESLPFKVDESTEIQTQTMFGTPNVGYAKADNAEIIELPLVDKDHTFVLVLPAQGQELEATLQTLEKSDSKILEYILKPEALEQTDVSLTMPKFKVETRFKLKETLNVDPPQFPGLGPIFDATANFSRMAENSNGMYVDEIHHKAIVSVDEKGVEAVGATGLSITLYSAFEPDLKIDVNRPFAFFIVNKPNGIILFAGKIKNPEK